MAKKKLLTLVAVLGILACGACLLPPLPQMKIPLPPNLAGVHKIAIRVEDGTADNFFDPVNMSSTTTDNFNRTMTDYRVRAQTFNARGDHDAVLRITVFSRAASCIPDYNGEYCSIELIASYTLTDLDGRVLISRPRESSKNCIWRQGSSLPDNLKVNTFRILASESLAATAGKMLTDSTHSQ